MRIGALVFAFFIITMVIVGLVYAASVSYASPIPVDTYGHTYTAETNSTLGLMSNVTFVGISAGIPIILVVAAFVVCLVAGFIVLSYRKYHR